MKAEGREGALTRPLFSVVTVALNCADDAVATAESVLAQRHAGYEYLVKDGGSTDGTAERLRALGVRVEVSRDGGVYGAMNQALPLCRGEYVVFMNAGDRFASPDALGAAAAAVERAGRPAMLYGDILSFSGHPAAGGEGRVISYPERISRFYLYRKMICHQAWFVRRERYVAAGGFDERYRLLADYNFLVGLAADRGARLVHIPAVTTRYQGGGASERNPEALAAELRAIRRQAFSPVERALFGTVYGGAGALARRALYGAIYPRLPAAAKARLNGL